MATCGPCGEHFGFRTPDVVDGFKKLKQDAINEATRNRKGRTAIQSLRRDLERFARGFPAQPNDLTQVPWNAQPNDLTRVQWNVRLIAENPRIADRLTVGVWTAKEPRPWADVQQNFAPGGCSMCHVLVGMLEYSHADGEPQPTSLTSEWVVEKGTLLPSVIKVHAYSSPACRAEDFLHTFQFYCKLDSFRAVDLTSHLPLVPNEPFVRNPRLRFLARTLQECRDMHADCAAAQTAGWVPTRLLNIDSSGQCFYLEEYATALGGGAVTYATLSHVWGPDAQIPARLTSENYEQYKDSSRGLGYWELPKAWQNAISKLRALDIRRVWVDALCIIQDSEEDWEREALAVGEVYRNAVCNLAMCDVRDAHGNRANGNIVNPDDAYIVYHANGNNADGNDANGNDAGGNDVSDNDVGDNDVDGNDANSNDANGNGVNGNNHANGNNHTNGNNHANGNGHANGNNANNHNADDNDTNDDGPPLPQHLQRFYVAHHFIQGRVVFNILPDWARLARDYSELYRRGWALQERLLSTRQLHFAAVPSFECHHSLSTQEYRQGIGKSPAFDEYLGSEKNWLPQEPVSVDVVLARWLENVEVFSGKAMSNPEDKLMAVGALAKWFSPLLEVSYFAGVWGGWLLIRGLLWTPDGERDAHPLPKYRAPSWSWASVDSAVHMTSKYARLEQTLVYDPTPSTTPKAEDPFGQVTDGNIRLIGHLIEVPDLLARLGPLKSAEECRLDRTDQVRQGDVIYFLPIARLIDERGGSFQGLFLQEVWREMEDEGEFETVRCFHRVGMGRMNEVRMAAEDDSPEFILNDDSWGALLLLSCTDLTTKMETMEII